VIIRGLLSWNKNPREWNGEKSPRNPIRVPLDKLTSKIMLIAFEKEMVYDPQNNFITE
jgi:hypothetical protein